MAGIPVRDTIARSLTSPQPFGNATRPGTGDDAETGLLWRRDRSLRSAAICLAQHHTVEPIGYNVQQIFVTRPGLRHSGKIVQRVAPDAAFPHARGLQMRRRNMTKKDSDDCS